VSIFVATFAGSHRLRSSLGRRGRAVFAGLAAISAAVAVAGAAWLTRAAQQQIPARFADSWIIERAPYIADFHLSDLFSLNQYLLPFIYGHPAFICLSIGIAVATACLWRLRQSL